MRYRTELAITALAAVWTLAITAIVYLR